MRHKLHAEYRHSTLFIYRLYCTILQARSLFFRAIGDANNQALNFVELYMGGCAYYYYQNYIYGKREESVVGLYRHGGGVYY